MTYHDAATQELSHARHNLIKQLRALEAAVHIQTERIAQGYSPDMRGVNRAWLAIDEPLAIHRACEWAVDEARLADVLRDVG